MVSWRTGLGSGRWRGLGGHAKGRGVGWYVRRAGAVLGLLVQGVEGGVALEVLGHVKAYAGILRNRTETIPLQRNLWIKDTLGPTMLSFVERVPDILEVKH